MKEVPLSKGKVALVDDGDYERVMSFKWRAARFERYGREWWYACRTVYFNNDAGVRCQRKEYLHRFIMNASGRTMVDHNDHNGLDCQRHNLRLATNRQNQFNANRRVDNSSGFRGVSAQGKGWSMAIRLPDGTRIQRGGFTSSEEAARAYDDAARQHHGEFARLNF